MKEIKVRLTTDLTKYLLGLVKGSEGFTGGKEGIWSRNFKSYGIKIIEEIVK